MKTAIACALSLMIGVVIGWYAEHGRANHERGILVDQMLENNESTDAVHVGHAILAIGLIESGKPQAAVERLSIPVAHYYAEYEDIKGANRNRLKLRNLIEELAKTNQTVARAIQESGKRYSK